MPETVDKTDISHPPPPSLSACSYMGIVRKKYPSNSDSDIVFKYEDAFVNTRWGKIKINEIKYEYEYKNEKKTIAIDAQDFVKAILKDALNGEIKLISNKAVR